MNKTQEWYYLIDNRSLKGMLIHLLGQQWPLRVREMHASLRKKNGFKVSYQAVHRALKQLVQDGYVVFQNRTYQLNKAWLTKVFLEIDSIRKGYGLLFSAKASEFNIITIRNHTLEEKMKQSRVASLFSALIPIFKQAFIKHNIFSGSKEEILQYLLDVHKQHDVLLFLYQNNVVGGVVLIQVEDDVENNYVRWKLRHFACSQSLPEKERLRYLREIIHRVQTKGKTVKIEYNMAENEPDYIRLFTTAGFVLEALLPDRYRLGEVAYKYSITLKSSYGQR